MRIRLNQRCEKIEEDVKCFVKTARREPVVSEENGSSQFDVGNTDKMSGFFWFYRKGTSDAYTWRAIWWSDS